MKITIKLVPFIVGSAAYYLTVHWYGWHPAACAFLFQLDHYLSEHAS